MRVFLWYSWNSNNSFIDCIVYLFSVLVEWILLRSFSWSRRSIPNPKSCRKKTLHLPAAARPGKCITRLQLHDGELKGRGFAVWQKTDSSKSWDSIVSRNRRKFFWIEVPIGLFQEDFLPRFLSQTCRNNRIQRAFAQWLCPNPQFFTKPDIEEKQWYF